MGPAGPTGPVGPMGPAGPTGPSGGLSTFAFFYSTIESLNVPSFGVVEFEPDGGSHQNVNIGGFTLVYGDLAHPTLITGVRVPLDGYYKITSYISCSNTSNGMALVKNIALIVPGNLTHTGVASGYTVLDPGIAGTESKTLFNQLILYLTATDILSLINSHSGDLKLFAHPSILGSSGASASMTIEYLGP